MRIDAYLTNINKYPSRTKALEAIKNGDVLYKNKPCKPSLDVTSLENITFIEKEVNFVSNGGYKLEKAIVDFNFDATNKIFCDIGASNGGFTNCLLNHNAKKVYAIDVGESQLDTTLKINEKVVVIDNFNARYLSKEKIGEFVDGVVCDVSFISLTYILNGIYNVLKDNGDALCLIKPQFECGKNCLTKQGIVKNVEDRLNCVNKIYNFALNLGFSIINLTNAPIKEKKNIEYIIWLKKNKNDKSISLNDISKIVLTK